MIKDNRSSVESDLNRHHVQYEDPLWKEDKETSGPLITINLSNKTGSDKGCIWSVFDNGKLMFTLPGQTLTLKQIHFLQSVDGVQFLLKKYKEGYCNASKLKGELKKLSL